MVDRKTAIAFCPTVWFVNFVGFTDGIDWMTVAGTCPRHCSVRSLSVFSARSHAMRHVAIRPSVARLSVWSFQSAGRTAVFW